jgi:hypothetical protein
LADVVIVDILNDQTLHVGGGNIRLVPGLRITGHPNTTILVAMPDAAVFGPKLVEASNDLKRRMMSRSTEDEQKLAAV